MTVSIPSWNAQGVLPPIDFGNPTSKNRSPYQVSLTEFVLHFGSSMERCRILDGFLRYRSELHALGLTEGFQWLDGSYLENIEVLEVRTPHDIDVVTFFQLPQGHTQRDLALRNPLLFDSTLHDNCKNSFLVDGYMQSLDVSSDKQSAYKHSLKLIRQSAYWYSIWAHRRNQIWKGFVEIALANSDDADAAALLKLLPMPPGVSA